MCAMRLENVKRVVYVSVQDADKAAWLPHFGGKVGVEEAVRRSGIPFTILRPNNFYQNDYCSRTCCCSTASTRSRSAAPA